MLKIIGDSTNAIKMIALLQAEFNGLISISSDNGNVTMQAKDKQEINSKFFKRNQFTNRQKKIYEVLNEIVSHKKSSFICVLSDAQRNYGLFGGWRSYSTKDQTMHCNTVEVKDAISFEQMTGGVFSATGFMLHEIYETYLDQLCGVHDYMEAHKRACILQGELDKIVIEPRAGHIYDETNSGYTYFFFTDHKKERYSFKATVQNLMITGVVKSEGWVGPNGPKGGQDILLKPKVG